MLTTARPRTAVPPASSHGYRSALEHGSERKHSDVRRHDSASPEDTSAVLRQVSTDLVEATEGLVARQESSLRERFPWSYASRTEKRIPDTCVQESARRNVARAARSLAEGRAPQPEQIDEAWVARERTMQGMPVGEMLDGYRLSHRAIRDGFVALARASGLEQSSVLAGVCLLWETADAGASALFREHRELELALARCDDDQRADFLRRLVHGNVDAAALREQAAVFGLAPDGRYHVVRARVADVDQRDGVRSRLESSGRLHGVSGLVAVIDEDVVGVLPRRPDLGGLTAVAGLSSATALVSASAAFTTASRMLEAAGRFGEPGVFGVEDLGLRLAVASEPELASMLVERYLGPLREEAAFGAVLEASVRSFIGTGRNLPRAARELGVHPNTLRYRLRRFQELVGVDLDDPRVLAEVWWAVESSSMERTSG